jgi:hypothetical protein
VIAGVDNMGGSTAGRLTNAGSGITGTTLGATGGAEKQTLLTANLPPYTPSGSVATTISGNFIQNGAGGTFQGVNSGAFPEIPTATSTFTGNAQGGTSTPVVTVSPTIVANKLLRVI